MEWSDDTVLPDWVQEIRPAQVEACNEILDAYERGVKMVVLDGPTGTGKTLIAEMVRRTMGKQSLYVCSGKDLQRQFVRDFDAPVLMGRRNYLTVNGGSEVNRWGGHMVTADDCTGQHCHWCPSEDECPYQQAKRAAMTGTPAVLNTAYALTEWNGPGRMRGRPFVVIDECDTLEDIVLGWAELDIRESRVKELGLRFPAKGAHTQTIDAWLKRFATAARAAAGRLPREDAKKKRTLQRVAQQAVRVVQTREDIDWVRMYRPGSFVLKPVRIGEFGGDWIWRHGHNWLLMSASVIGPQRMLEDLGWVGEWEHVQVDSTFPPENRWVYPMNSATMTKKGREDGEWDTAVQVAGKILEHHWHHKILIHTVNYDLSEMVVDALSGQRDMFWYRTGEGREKALKDYLESDNGVLVAPSMMRGVDLPDDACRVQIIMKVPYQSLGDPQVAARLHHEGGQEWYLIKAVQNLVQMTGRGMRHEDDHCVTYVLDRQFGNNIDKWKKWLPPWWWEGVERWTRPERIVPGIATL